MKLQRNASSKPSQKYEDASAVCPGNQEIDVAVNLAGIQHMVTTEAARQLITIPLVGSSTTFWKRTDQGCAKT